MGVIPADVMELQKIIPSSGESSSHSRDIGNEAETSLNDYVTEESENNLKLAGRGSFRSIENAGNLSVIMIELLESLYGIRYIA